jgi:AcrR family transcriptional regulator
MSRASSKPAQPEATRDAILAASLRVLAAEGHDALTVRRVAAEAGCSTIGVYTWFGGKEGLLEALYIEGFASFTKALKRAKDSTSPHALLLGQARQYRKWALANPLHYRVMFLRVGSGFEPHSEEAQQAGQAAFDVLLHAVRVATDRGEIHEPDSIAVAMNLWATMHGLVSLELMSVVPPVAEGQQRLADRAFEVSLNTITRGLLPG